MNSREKRLRFIRYKNGMRLKGYKKPKWVLRNKKWWPYVWDNKNPGLLEESWLVDMEFQ